MMPLTGNTYHIKDKIKASGGRWNSVKKCWFVPECVFEELTILAFRKDKVLSGQLWEPCERCGQEPVYMSLNNLCERCG